MAQQLAINVARSPNSLTISVVRIPPEKNLAIIYESFQAYRKAPLLTVKRGKETSYIRGKGAISRSASGDAKSSSLADSKPDASQFHGQYIGLLLPPCLQAAGSYVQ